MEWISVKDRLPDRGIRVWAHDGLTGNDCYYGHQPMRCSDEKPTFGEVEWRYSFNQEPVRYPITFWQPLPPPPETAMIEQTLTLLKELNLRASMNDPDLLEITQCLDEHPDGYEGPCLCRMCASYGE